MANLPGVRADSSHRAPTTCSAGAADAAAAAAAGEALRPEREDSNASKRSASTSGPSLSFGSGRQSAYQTPAYDSPQLDLDVLVHGLRRVSAASADSTHGIAKTSVMLEAETADEGGATGSCGNSGKGADGKAKVEFIRGIVLPAFLCVHQARFRLCAD